MNIKKIMAGLLALLTAASFAACSSDGDTQNADTTAADTTAAETAGELSDEDKYQAAKAAMPEADYDGHEFLIVTREDTALKWHTRDVYAETETGDAVNDAVYERNMALEEHFNIKIKQRPIDLYAVSTTVATEIMSGDETFDVVTDGITYLLKTLATADYLVNLNDVSEIDLSQDYWDQNINKYFSIKGKTFIASGEISIMDNLGTWVVLFNKDMVKDYNLEDPYTNVHNGTWTLDLFYDMAKAAAVDLDGDGEMTENDQWGFLSENFNTFALWSASGERLTKINSDGIPELCMYNERAVAVLEKAQKIQLDRGITITGTEHKDGMYGIIDDFGAGKGLFTYGGLMLVTDYRDDDINFGIVPAPKYDEAQDSYYSTYSDNNTTAYAIPITASNTSRTGTILEQMAILSEYTLTPAYYDITLEGKALRDEESAAMIDIILDSRNFDLGMSYDWGTIQSMFQKVFYNQKSTDFASAYAAIEANAIAAIDQFVESLED